MKWEIFICVSFLISCGGSKELTLEEKLEKFCEKQVYCGTYTVEECRIHTTRYLIAEGCIDAILVGGREDCSTTQDQEVYDICYPPCSEPASYCSGDDIVNCNGERKTVINCWGDCQLQGFNGSQGCIHDSVEGWVACDCI